MISYCLLKNPWPELAFDAVEAELRKGVVAGNEAMLKLSEDQKDSSFVSLFLDPTHPELPVHERIMAYVGYGNRADFAKLATNVLSKLDVRLRLQLNDDEDVRDYLHRLRQNDFTWSGTSQMWEVLGGGSGLRWTQDRDFTRKIQRPFVSGVRGLRREQLERWQTEAEADNRSHGFMNAGNEPDPLFVEAAQKLFGN